MQKALVICECFSDNIGDQAIAYSMRKKLEEFYPQVDLVDFSFRESVRPNLPGESARPSRKYLMPEVLKKTSLFLFLKRLHFFLRHLHQAFKVCRGSYEIAVIGGGQLVMGNQTFPVSMLLWTYLLKLANTRVKLVSVGVASSFSAVDSFLFRLALAPTEFIYARDSKSLSILKSITGRPCRYIPDIAYALELEVNPSFSKERDLYILSPVEYSVYKRYIVESNLPHWTEVEYVEQWVSILEQAQGQLVIAPTTQKDYMFSEKVLDRYRAKNRSGDSKAVELVSLDGWQDFVLLAKRASVVCSGRMHALILGQVSGADVEPFLLSEKLISFSIEGFSGNVSDLKALIDTTFIEICV